jgi:TonB family protein
VRWDSPFVLATSGTLAIHIVVAVCADAIIVTHPITFDPPAPHIELVEIEPPPMIVKPPPPPVATPEPPTQEAPRPIIKQARATAPIAHAEPPPASPPPVTSPEPAAPGGAPIVAMDDIAPGATGVGVAHGPRTTGHIGRGGTGQGTGAGSGSGSAELPPPVSVATIKTRALPKGDYGYVAAGADYPAEAKQLGIEGPIRVKLVVDETGKVRSSVLLNRLGHGLDELALRQAAAIEFEPARDTDDHPVTSVVIWTFQMTLPK